MFNTTAYRYQNNIITPVVISALKLITVKYNQRTRSTAVERTICV